MPKNVPSRRETTSQVELAIATNLTTSQTTFHTTPTKFFIAEINNFKFVPNSSVDLLLTDPPFNIAQDTNFHTWQKNTINSYRFDTDKGWDSHEQHDFLSLLQVWAHEFARVLRKGGSFAIFCADEYLSHFHNALTAAGLNVRRTLTWRKPNAVPINRKTMMMSACEYVLVGVKGAKATFNADIPVNAWETKTLVETVLVADKTVTIIEKAVRAALETVTISGEDRPQRVVEAVLAGIRGAETSVAEKVSAMFPQENGETFLRGCVPNIVNFSSKSGTRLHPTEKPVPLLQYLIQLLSSPCDIVLDPFAGSGSTGEAAILESRFVILTEMDSEYFGKAANRLTILAPHSNSLLF